MSLRPVVLAAMLACVSGCSKRQVDVRTAPAQATGVSIQVKNTLNQAVRTPTIGAVECCQGCEGPGGRYLEHRTEPIR